MAIVEQRDHDLVPVNAACDALEVSRATLYRSRRSRFIGPLVARVCAPSPRRLGGSGSLVQVGVTLAIGLYLHLNVKRLAGEAKASDAAKAVQTFS